jgi:hypothetical protein
MTAISDDFAGRTGVIRIDGESGLALNDPASTYKDLICDEVANRP